MRSLNPYSRRGKLLPWRKWLLVMCFAAPLILILVLPLTLITLLVGGGIRISHVLTA